MSRKAKTPKFETFKQLPNCFDFYLGQDWHEFWLNTKPTQPVTLELGCGRAELLLELARHNPSKRFVGMDIKSDRMYRPAETAIREKLGNICFIRAHAERLEEVFRVGEVRELWLTFPDPFPKLKSAKHRLLHPQFLDRYARVLETKTTIHFKTDNESLFEWGLEQLGHHQHFELVTISRDLHTDNQVDVRAKALTTYERKFIGQNLPIYYARADLR